MSISKSLSHTALWRRHRNREYSPRKVLILCLASQSFSQGCFIPTKECHPCKENSVWVFPSHRAVEAWTFVSAADKTKVGFVFPVILVPSPPLFIPVLIREDKYPFKAKCQRYRSIPHLVPKSGEVSCLWQKAG